MSKSFAKEFVQLSAVGLSTLLKQSAKIIETAADVVDWPKFEVVHNPSSTVLTFNLGDLDASEFEVTHNDQAVRLNIRPFCPDYLIPNIGRFTSGHSTDKRERLSKFASAHQHLRWSTCTVDELNGFFSEWIFGVEGESGGQFPWQARAVAMLKPVVSGAILARDAGTCKLSAAWFRQQLPLDTYVTFLNSEIVDQQAFIDYLNGLPGFHIQECQENNLSPKCYEQHGHLVMQVVELLATDQKSSVVRTERRPDRDIAHNFMSKTVVSAEAVRIENRLEITVKHASKEFVRLKVQD